jgi:hypothetical protein
MSTHFQASFPCEEKLVPGQQYTVLSMHPIWAWAVLFGGKDVENRAWVTKQRGRILIHASSDRKSMREEQDMRSELSFLTGIAKAELPVRFVRSSIVGSVEIVECVKDACSKWAVPGQQHWLLSAPHMLAVPLVDVQGRQRFWHWTCEAGAALALPDDGAPSQASS